MLVVFDDVGDFVFEDDVGEFVIGLLDVVFYDVGYEGIGFVIGVYGVIDIDGVVDC